LGVPELGCRLIAFGLVAVVAGEDQIARSIGASTAARNLVIDLEGDLSDLTVGTAMLEFL
jgi:hypothetical protein